MNYIVTGTDQATGKRVRGRIQASSSDRAMEAARERGIIVEHCEPEPTPEAAATVPPDSGLDEMLTADEAHAAREASPPRPRRAHTRVEPGAVITEALVASALNVARSVLTESLYDRVAGALRVIGNWGSLVAAVLGAAFFAIVAVRADSLNQALLAGGWVLAVVVLQFIGTRFVGSCDAVGRQAQCRMATTAFFDCLALLILIGTVAMTGFGIYTAIQKASYDLIAVAAVYLFIGAMLASLALHPAAMQVEIAKDTRPGEEAIGILTFLFKLILKAAPVFYGVFVVGGIALIVWGIVGVLRRDGRVALNGIGGMELVAFGLLAPLLFYLLFLAYYLAVDVIRATLSLPGKLDRLIEK